jgi:mannose-6-phosphate isomerase-like protein (cupin superfamily)
LSPKVVDLHVEAVDSDVCSFPTLLNAKPDAIVRDSFVLLSPEKGGSESITMGYTVVYPGCRTRGHQHADLEEAYFVVKGRGTAVVGEEEFEISQGSAFYVPFGKFHAVKNPYKTCLEYVWAIAPKR